MFTVSIEIGIQFSELLFALFNSSQHIMFMNILRHNDLPDFHST